MLRKTLLYFGFCLTLCSASHAQTPATGDVEPKRVFVYERRVSFVPPVGFTPPSDDVVRKKFPNAVAPAIVYANGRVTTSVAFSFYPQEKLTPEQLPGLKSSMKSFLDKQQPGIEWLKHELVEINGVTWVHFEFLSRARDAKIRNDMLFTSVNQRMVLFNFNSTNSEYAKYEKELARSKASIRVSK